MTLPNAIQGSMSHEWELIRTGYILEAQVLECHSFKNIASIAGMTVPNRTFNLNKFISI